MGYMQEFKNKAMWAISNPIASITLASTASVVVLSFLSATAYMLLRTREYSSTTSRIETDAIIKMLPKNSKWSKSERYVPSVGWVSNWVFTFQYVARIKALESERGDHSPSYEVTIWRCCFQPWDEFDAMIRPPTAPVTSETEAIVLPVFLDHVVRGGANLAWPWYSVDSKYAHMPGTPESELVQADTLARRAILQLNEIGSGVIMVCGPPATGKTSSGVRAAQLLGPNTLVCTCMDPSRAGHLIADIIRARNEHDPTATLVIIKNEIDIILDNLGSIPVNTKIVTEVTDKASWNDWLDDIHRCKNVVVWLTSNADDAKVAAYDPSLLREKRVTAHYRATGSASFGVVHEQRHVKQTASLSPRRSSSESESENESLKQD